MCPRGAGPHQLGIRLEANQEWNGTSQIMGMEPDKVRELLSVRALRCEACELSKKQKFSQPSSSRSRRDRSIALPHDVVCADHCGPFPPQVGGGHTHFTLFVDFATK